MPRRIRRGLPGRGRPSAPLFGSIQPRIGDPARDHYAEDDLSDNDVLAAYWQRDRWLFRTTRGMNMWEGPDASQLRRIVLGIMHEGPPEAVILHASLTSSQRHSTGTGRAGEQYD
jgi:hypothetical protein